MKRVLSASVVVGGVVVFALLAATYAVVLPYTFLAGIAISGAVLVVSATVGYGVLWLSKAGGAVANRGGQR